MIANLLAEAGLSECARAGMDCPGFGIGPVEIVIVGILAIAWLMMAASATVAILSSKLPARERMLWLVAVWVIPVVGGVMWFIHAGVRSSAAPTDRTS